MATGRKVAYWGDGDDLRDGEVEAVNGNLAYVRDEETGEADWKAPHELPVAHRERVWPRKR